MKTTKYVRKVETVEAVQLTLDNFLQVEEWCGGKTSFQHKPFKVSLTVPNVEGNQVAVLKAHLNTNEKRGINFGRYELLAERGLIHEFEDKDLIEEEGDYVVKSGNKFSVIKFGDMNNYARIDDDAIAQLKIVHKDYEYMP